MAVEADKVIVALETQGVAKQNAEINSAATTFEKAAATSLASANKIEKANNVVAISSGRAANATRNLGRQVSDIGTGLAGGQNPFLIIAQQAPQVADALADTGGKAARFAAFFTGPFGAALLAAASIVGTVLIPKLFESGNAAADAAPKLDRYAQALAKIAGIDLGALGAQSRLAEITSKLALIDKGINPDTGQDAKFLRGSGLGTRRRELEKEAAALKVVVDLDKISTQRTEAAEKAKEAARAAASKAKADATKAQNEAEAAAKKLQSDLVALEKAYSPLTAAVREYEEALKDIAALEALGAGNKGISAETAEKYRQAAEARRIAQSGGVGGASIDDISNRPGGIRYQAELENQRIADQAGKRLQEEGRVNQVLAAQQEAKIQTLANFYENAFLGGTGSIWKQFEREGLKVLALLLAKFTVLQAGGGGGFFSNLASAASSALGGSSFFGGFRASGGNVSAGMMYGVNEGGRTEGFRPSQSGQIIPLGRMKGAGGSTIIVQQQVSVDARNSVNPDGFARQILTISQQQANRAAATAGKATLAAVPGRIAQYQTDGI